MTPQQQEALQRLPAVGVLLNEPDVQDWIDRTSRPAVVSALQDAIDAVRRRVLAAAEAIDVDAQAVLDEAKRLLEVRSEPSLRRVVNATGIVLHTGLGRAPLADVAIEAIVETAGAYCNVEYDVKTARRGKRQRHVTKLICDLTGAEAATVVNNNAAATLLILATLAQSQEVVVSRGQLVEIGGSYRLPAIMQASGAVLREVGATNRTRIGDYAAAIGDQTAVLMHVHTSNYRIVGFTEEAPIEAIAELAHRFDLYAVDDLGSGALFDLTEIGLPAEPVARDSIEAGADLVCFSGDKLLGGPQCGIICGRKELIQRIEAHPLMRTYRLCKITLAALEATLREYEDPLQAARRIPSLALLAADPDDLAHRAEALQEHLAAALPDERFYVCSDVSFAGGGSLPAETLDTVVVQWRPQAVGIDVMTARLRRGNPPVVVRVRDDAIVFDVRTISEGEFDEIAAAAAEACRAPGHPDRIRD